MAFDVAKITEELVAWLQKWFDENGKGCKAVLGISGGKDSSIAAALCVKALGKENVYGVLMPNGVQSDIKDAYKLVDFLGINYSTINIELAVQSVLSEMNHEKISISEQTMINLPPRIRMSTLYAVSQSVNGRVINTCNLSEDWVGYSTRYGDSVGDVSPFSNLTVAEVKEIGRYLGLPKELVDKVPSDGLCSKTDEDALGFSYEVLDKYIRTGVCEDEHIKNLIDKKHNANLFKLKPMPAFMPLSF